MPSNKYLPKQLTFSIFFVALYSVAPYTEGGIQIFNTTIWWGINALILILFWKTKKKIYNSDSDGSIFFFVNLYLLWNIICAFRGVFIAETYWDWKLLVGNSMALLLPLIAYLSSNIFFSQFILKKYIKYALPFFCLFILIITKDSFGFYLVPISFISLFLPLLERKHKILIILISCMVIFADFGARSNVIKFVVPILFSSLYFLRKTTLFSFFELGRKLLFVTPILLFILAINGIFNPFKMDTYIETDIKDIKTDKKGNIIVDNIKADTRTFLYVEVLQSAKKRDFWIIGRSPARGYDTEYFASISKVTGRKERGGCEVAILNVFTWSGLIGVILYLLVFYKASYLAINKSNSSTIKIIGLYIAFRWVYSWVEDINYFTLTTYMLWFCIGLCLSKNFRELTDNDFKIWARGIFISIKPISPQYNKKL